MATKMTGLEFLNKIAPALGLPMATKRVVIVADVREALTVYVEQNVEKPQGAAIAGEISNAKDDGVEIEVSPVQIVTVDRSGFVEVVK